MSSFDQSVPDDKKAVLLGMLKALEPFFELNSTMPLQYVTAFLEVAANEGQTVSEYAKKLGVSQSLMTRYLADIGETNRHHEPGHDLVVAKRDVMDRRTKRNQLTAKGQHLVGQLSEALAKAMPEAPAKAMPKFYVQTWVRVYLGGLEVEADSYHEAAVKAERLIRRDYVKDEGEEKLITGQYTQMIEAKVHLGDWESSHENTRFLELAMDGGEDHLPEFEEISDLVWNGHKCTPRGDIHERISDA
jgi:DNA-binding MarR family transcriptional regulator